MLACLIDDHNLTFRAIEVNLASMLCSMEYYLQLPTDTRGAMLIDYHADTVCSRTKTACRCEHLVTIPTYLSSIGG